jgi:hypothetical protein
MSGKILSVEDSNVVVSMLLRAGDRVSSGFIQDFCKLRSDAMVTRPYGINYEITIGRITMSFSSWCSGQQYRLDKITRLTEEGVKENLKNG